jgi:hypothetical protein
LTFLLHFFCQEKKWKERKTETYSLRLIKRMWQALSLANFILTKEGFFVQAKKVTGYLFRRP